MIGNIKGTIDKVASRKLDITAVAGAAAATGVVEITWPMAAVAVAYIAGQTVVDLLEGDLQIQQVRTLLKELEVAYMQTAGAIRRAV